MRRLLALPLVGGLILLAASSQALGVHWGKAKDDGCVSQGFRQKSAILWGLPKGSNWEAACMNTPNGDWGTPTRCKNVSGINIWGQWERPDAECY